MTERLDRLLFSYASLVKKKIPKADSMYPGTGGGRRFGICISYIYGCTVGIRYPDCNKRNRLGAGKLQRLIL